MYLGVQFNELFNIIAHGTYIGSLRIESNKPTQLPIDSNFHFGASTRNYIIRERPQTGARPIIEELEKQSEEAEGGLLGLPETETELDNLTEFNTAHNRRISMLGIGEENESANNRVRKRKKRGVTFNEDEEVINPEDVDPSVGRFRNLIHTTVIPSKRQRLESGVGLTSGLTQPEERHHHNLMKHLHPTAIMNQLYQDIPGTDNHTVAPNTVLFSSALASRLGLALPNPAPDVDMAPPTPIVIQQEIPIEPANATNIVEPKKKKYAKEAWPGKKPMPALLV
uniref:Nuclear inhibitor of protein phosphatase 1 n=1 Tax=Clastoptera arizonana TaxID=38151 RepID=A0A1B6DQE1_9HEMI